MAQGLGENLAINIGVNVTGLPQVQQVQARMTSLNKTIQKSTSQYNTNAVATNKWAKGALQQAGYQVGDFAVQVANGTSKMQAFGQQGSQLAGIFGPVGAIIGAGIAIVSAFAVAAEKASGNVMSLAKAAANLRSEINDLKTQVDLLNFGAKSEEELAFLKEIDKKQRELNGLYSEREKLITRQAQILMRDRKFQDDEVAAQRKAVEILDKQLAARGKIIEKTREELQGFRDRLSYLKKHLEAANDILGTEEGLKAAVLANNKLFEDRAAIMESAALATNKQMMAVELAHARIAGKAAKDAAERAKAEDAARRLQYKFDLASYGAGRAGAGKAMGMEPPAVAAARTAVSNVKDEFESMFKELDNQVNSFASSIADAMSSGFMAMIDGTKSVKDAFRAMAADIVRELYRVLVVQQLVGGFDAKTGERSGVVGALMGGFAGKRAMGGPVTGGKAYVVGERGPEAFIPTRSGYIAPNVSASATPSVTINQTFTGGVTQGDLARMLPQITEMTKRAIIDQVQRGGATARVFR